MAMLNPSIVLEGKDGNVASGHHKFHTGTEIITTLVIR
jgi:hypothetical protein